MRQDALILRLVGPLIQVACLAGLIFKVGRGRSVGGVPLDDFFYGGFALGLVLVLAGLALGRSRPRQGDPYDAPRPRDR